MAANSLARKLTLLPLFVTSLAAAAEDPALLVAEPETLAVLEAQGAGFGARVATADALQNANNADLYRESAWFLSLADEVASELSELRRADPRLGPTMKSPHRLFDVRWLSSRHARFELAAVINRLDRRPFSPSRCGETRLVYRLRYSVKQKNGTLTSRLPFTVNAVYWQDEATGEKSTGCADVAKRWLALRGMSGAALAAALVAPGGILAPKSIGTTRLKAIEINLQSVRWPSTTRPDLGAHAEYLLRVFHPSGDAKKLVPASLENTPDLEKIRTDHALRAELLKLLKDKSEGKRIDDGIAVLPEKFLAVEATSVSPRGLTRLQNRPFSQLFNASDFQDLPFEDFRLLKSAEAYLRRLDDLTCVGCHQSRSVAGFHALGRDRADTEPVNAIQVTGSPHLMNDLARRRAYVEALARGEAATETRPLSDRADAGEGGYGSHCGLSDPGFKSWDCKPGFICKASGNAKGDLTVGQCFPAKSREVGDPCEEGHMVKNQDGRRDKVTQAKESPCANGGVCEANSVGFPEGMCAVACSREQGDEDVACGKIAILMGFNTCLSQGKPFTSCLSDNVRPAGLRRCSDDKPCRDDYLCARTSEGAGACIPPYFLFQMRVDGHPSP